jgi:Icc-related predicted phosphoesterase
MVRIFHACDPHGSEIVWRKMVRMGTYHNANVLMMCGDLTGKAIVPIVKRKENEWYCKPRGYEEVMHTREEVEVTKERFRNMGMYPIEMTPSEVEELKADPRKLDTLFIRLMKETLERWLNLVEEKTPKDVMVIVNPGNDDAFEIDEVIKRNPRVVYPLERVVEINDGYKIISCAHVNPSPWRTHRECDEERLKDILEKEFQRVGDVDKLICNFHAPPFNTNLDIAPKLDKNLKPVTRFGSPVMEHVGSKAVREVIERHQPLLGLFGHIHESHGFDYLGRTLCLNPGSEYDAGLLRGYVIDLPREREGKLQFFRVEG